MIPKKIHYCWFGRNKKPELALNCIESWKKYCPDYEMIEWNEENFDIESNQYVKEAYEAKKFAFVSDYVRLYALHTMGGIYMDTDVMVLKKLDEFLHHDAFSGFESTTKIQTGIIGSIEKNQLIKELLSYYDDVHFIMCDGSYNMLTNVETITKIMLGYGFCPNGKFQRVAGFTLYPQNIFCPDHKKLNDEIYMKETVTIHYFAGSWKSNKTKRRESSLWWKVTVVIGSKVSYFLKSVFGKKWIDLKNEIIKYINKLE